MLLSFFRFIFFLFYLIASEVPLFFILLIRNNSSDSTSNLISILMIVSIIINLIIFGYLLFKVSRFARYSKGFTINQVSENKVKQNLSDFFSFFLLPFFTFNFTSNSNVFYLLLELFVLFILLTIFLMKTNNLTLNVIVFLIFNAFACQTTGKKIMVITEESSDDIECQKNIKLIKVIDNIYIFTSNHKKLSKKLSASIIFFVSALLLVIYYKFNLSSLLIWIN